MSASIDPAAAASEPAAAGPRSRAQRTTDTLAWLTAPAADAWVATAGDDGPYMVPLSVVWTGGRLVLAIAESSRTFRNIRGTGAARLGLGRTRDVVMIDTELDRTVPVAGAPGETGGGEAGGGEAGGGEAGGGGTGGGETGGGEAGAAEIGAAYAAQADWDPREDPTGYHYVVLRPIRIQAWRETNEISGRLLMRDGEWLTSGPA